MLFTEPTFLFLFLPILLGLSYAGRTRPSYANWLLVAASVLFYAVGGGAFTWLMLGSIAFNYLAAIGVDRARGSGRDRLVLGVVVGINLAVLALFKYAGFVVDNVNAVWMSLGGVAFAAPTLVLPIGISFYTFHAISYVVDVYRRDADAQKHPVHAALYLLLFPQLIAGPIVRYRDLAGQLARRVVQLDDLAWGMRRFAIGLAKKMLVANVVAEAADGIFGLPMAQVTPAHAWLGAVCYAFQIYFDFSGYSDMAIGLGRMFGFRFPENFRWPYTATSVQDFWRRWHISLSSWFRDYLYIPLGGNRGSSTRTALNLLTVFFLCGLWHGANWTFVVWGLYHGAFLMLERAGLGAALARLWRPLRHAYALLAVLVGWVFFRAETLDQALTLLAALAGRPASAPTPYTVHWYLTPLVAIALGVACVASLPVGAWLSERFERATALRPDKADTGDTRLVAAFNVAATAVLLIASVAQIAAKTYNPFIYFRF
jgi:alginate O-acetyltransferase complex protein AlgI